MKFVVGIGNPGKQYERTRHNVGFLILDLLAVRFKVSHGWKEVKKLQAMVSACDQATLVKPVTFVNQTGESIAALVREYHLGTQDILVVADDVNLDFGKLRLRDSGSAGGHHGLESTIAALGVMDFPRLRFGVRNEDMPKDLNSYVLGKFNQDEKTQVADILERAVLICESWINEGFDAATKRLSQLQGQEKRRNDG